MPMVRSRASLKSYIVVFVCFSTKAVHIEIAMDLTTQSFFKVFKRFISRRGYPNTIWSDNGTNFIGAKNELQKFLLSAAYDNYIMTKLTKLNIQWKLIPPRSPHIGGLWEASVKSIKFHLKRVLQNVNFIFYDDLFTLVVEIENLLNSRPLYPMSSDPNDLDVLTPNHFLLGSTGYSMELPIKCTKHYSHIMKMKRDFWVRWSLDYLHNLQQRGKWTTVSVNKIALGDLVL